METANLPAERKESPAAEFRDQFAKLDRELATALPPHIPVERFMRVVLTAVNGNPALLGAHRRSLFEAAMKAAQDGLLPDGRDGALVTFRTKIKGEDGRDAWIDKVQWMPMIGGILKKVRNSGDLVTISAHVVYEADSFEYVLGDEERIEHKPKVGADRGKPYLVYAIAKTKDGGIYREIMSLAEVEKVRSVSRAKTNGPWVEWWDEMAKKTVLRRLSKRLPMSSDLDDLIRRDDELYDFKGKRIDGEGQRARVFSVVENPLSDEAPKRTEIEGSARENAASGSMESRTEGQGGVGREADHSGSADAHQSATEADATASTAEVSPSMVARTEPGRIA